MFIYFKILLLVISFFLLRPSGLGQQYTNYGLCLILVAFFLHAIEQYKYKNSYYLPKKNVIVIGSSLLLWLYLFAQSVMVGANNIDFVLKASVAHITTIICYGVILSHKKSNYLFFRWIIKIFVLFSISYYITFVISLFVGGDFNRLFLFTIPIESYETSGNVYLPFTQLYGFMNVGNISLPRSLGLFRESGIFQAFLIWAFFNLKQYDLESRKNKIIILLGIISTFSTSGIVIFFVVYSINLFFAKKRLLSMILILIGIFAALYTPYIGLHYKSETHGTSISDRTSATKNGLERLIENPIGVGLYNKDDYESGTAGINLMALSYKIGAMGLILVMIVYFFPMFRYPYKNHYLVGVMPFLVTLIISQPILDAPIIYVMFLANYCYDDKIKKIDN